MKKITHLLGIFCLLPTISLAQITILETDMAQIGDAIARQTDTLAVVTQGGAGANQVWDMTNVVAHLSETVNVIAPSTTPYASGFSSSNVAMTSDNVTYLYFEQNTNSLVATGFAGDAIGTGTPIIVSFNPSSLVQNFPQNYGDNFTDTYGLDITTDGSAFGVSEIRYKREAVVFDSTDGWGNLSTPDGNYNALRVKHVEQIKDSIWAKLLPILPFQLFSAISDTTVSYKWYAKDGKLAVAELSVDSLGNPSQFTWVGTGNVSIENEMSNVLQAQVYPQPAANTINIRLANTQKSGFHKIEMTTLEGKKVFEQEIELDNHKAYSLDISSVAAGLYLYKLTNLNTQQSTQNKLSIVK